MIVLIRVCYFDRFDTDFSSESTDKFTTSVKSDGECTIENRNPLPNKFRIVFGKFFECER